MDTRNQREEEILDNLRRLKSPQEQEAYLMGACGDDTQLRESVEALFEAYQDAEDLFKPVKRPERRRPPRSRCCGGKPKER